MSFIRDLRFAVHSLARTPGLACAVILTLALGIGANAAIFTLVRGVLLRPLVNRDEDRLIYIRQSAPGIGAENDNFSVPEIQDLRASVKSVSEFGDFSAIGFTMIGLGEPREIRAGVVGGSYFEVMGLRPVLGRLMDQRDDGPNAAGAAVLTYRYWTTALHSDPSVIGKQSALIRVLPHRWSPRAFGSLSRRHRAHHQRRDQPASSFRHHGPRSGSSDDGIIWPSCSGSLSRSGSRRVATAYSAMKKDHLRRILPAGNSRLKRRCCAMRSLRALVPCCWSCSLLRASCSLSRAVMWRI